MKLTFVDSPKKTQIEQFKNILIVIRNLRREKNQTMSSTQTCLMDLFFRKGPKQENSDLVKPVKF